MMTARPSTSARAASHHVPAALRAVLRHRISSVRAVMIGFIGVYATFLHYTSLPALPLGRVLVLVAFEIAVVVPFRAWDATGRALGPLLALSFGVDLVVLPIALVSIPQVPLVFDMLYVLIIVPVALTSTAWGIGVTGIASLSHIALALTIRRGDISPAEIGAPIVIFLLAGQQTVFYSRRLAATAHEADTEWSISAALLQVARDLATAASSTALLQRVAELARERSGGEWACVFTRDTTRGTYRVAGLVSRTGIVDEEIRSVNFGPGDFPDMLVGRVGDTCISLCPEDTPSPIHERWRLGSFLAVALRRETLPVGLLLVGQPTDGDTAATKRLLAGIAHQAVLALENARLLEDLRAANTLKSQFVDTVSHELRSPLNAILGYVEMLRDEDGEPGNPTREGRQAIVGRVQAHSIQLLELVTAMLDVSRLEAGRLPVTRARVDLVALLAAARDALPEDWRKPEVTLEWWNGSLPSVETDGEKVKTILRNLVHNALKFTERGRVSVSIGVDRPAPDPNGAAADADVDASDGILRMIVADTGVGIAADKLGLIFEMFRQGDASDTRRHGGVGLGLYIVRRLVDALGGTINVESTEGQGSVFTVTLSVRLSVERRADQTASVVRLVPRARAAS